MTSRRWHLVALGLGALLVGVGLLTWAPLGAEPTTPESTPTPTPSATPTADQTPPPTPMATDASPATSPPTATPSPTPTATPRPDRSDEGTEEEAPTVDAGQSGNATGGVSNDGRLLSFQPANW